MAEKLWNVEVEDGEVEWEREEVEEGEVEWEEGGIFGVALVPMGECENTHWPPGVTNANE